MMRGEADAHAVMETELLQAVCATKWTSIPHGLRTRLQQYCWRNPEHQIVFEALQTLPAGPVEQTQEHLQVALVRMGFPDVAFAIGASGECLDAHAIEALLRRLESPQQQAANSTR
jgi:hypothetical protein